ncbi:MAG: quinoprotein dehydrogenase-associated putative ABC transporter substrate-binding protein [Geminicoccaceae bacterium]
MTHARRGLALSLAIGLTAGLAGSAFAAQNDLGELVDRTALRVCADPANMPFSNEAGEGFENAIAKLMADELAVPVEYVWYPNTIGMVRNTLRADKCDLIMGVVAADELVQNTNPYYRSSYVMITRDADGDRFADLDSPDFMLARIGLVAGTPPADILARRGLAGNIQPYHLLVDTRVEQPAKDMLNDLVAGRIDVALVWGPIGGYYAKNASVPLKITPLPSDPRAGLRMDFRISMGIRPNEPNWKREINTLIRKLQPKITTILKDYGVPLLDEQGRLITGAADTGGPSGAVPEPASYRMDKYRAPVPATLQGATVLDAPGLQKLLASDKPVLVDVLPEPRKPANRDPNQLWMPPKRQEIPGSVWLPNVGYGELSPEFATWFREELEKLTGGDKSKPLVFYCDANCWMSWNAAKRALSELGYTRVYWFPEGVTGWAKTGLEVVDATPPDMPDFIQ